MPTSLLKIGACRKFPAMRRQRGFTLVEMVIAVFIIVLILALGVPSLTGVLADRRLRGSYNEFNKLAATAQQLSVSERRPFLIVWEERRVLLRPEAFREDEKEEPRAVIETERGEAYTLTLPAALTEKTDPAWVFWPSGNCEPALVGFKGPQGRWSALFSGLTARATLQDYAPN